jgi:hypothetical protein
MWDHEIYERTPHLAQGDSDPAAAAMTANSHDSLKAAVIGVIRNGERQADIRVTDYPGELTRADVSALIREIQTQEPIGAYAVDYIDFDLPPPVLSQYTVTLYIVYNHTVRPVITPVSGREKLEEAVHSALRDRRDRLTVEMPYYNAQEHDIENMARLYYYSHPAWAMEYPEVAVSQYPSSGNSLQRIVEFEMIWQSPDSVLRRKTQDTENGAEALLSMLPEFSGSAEEQTAQIVLWLYESLGETVLYDSDAVIPDAAGGRPGGESYTAYGALVNNLAVSEGYAMALKLLCDKLDIDGVVVTGRRQGDGYSWNLLRIGTVWYHIGYDFFLLDDESVPEEFGWDKTHIPAAEPGPWTAEGIRELSAGDPDGPPEE